MIWYGDTHDFSFPSRLIFPPKDYMVASSFLPQIPSGMLSSRVGMTVELWSAFVPADLGLAMPTVELLVVHK